MWNNNHRQTRARSNTRRHLRTALLQAKSASGIRAKTTLKATMTSAQLEVFAFLWIPSRASERQTPPRSDRKSLRIGGETQKNSKRAKHTETIRLCIGNSWKINNCSCEAGKKNEQLRVITTLLLRPFVFLLRSLSHTLVRHASYAFPLLSPPRRNGEVRSEKRSLRRQRHRKLNVVCHFSLFLLHKTISRT
jgi:hypothetical protein